MHRVVADGGASTLAALAREAALPLATAHRLVATMVRSGFLVAAERGRYVAGPTLLLQAGAISFNATMAALARPVLRRLLRETGCIAHLGVLENDMVTYLVKAGGDDDVLFTREGMQLEAYCSGIGKMLLACLAEPAREEYLSAGPFIALTPATITAADALRREFECIRSHDFAIDRGEIAVNLRCVAVPVRGADAQMLAAISISRLNTDDDSADHRLIAAARRRAAELERRLMDALFTER